MNYYLAKLQYDGTDYFGFQWQKDLPTIQNDFNQALATLGSGSFSTMGASRTDSGVHAFEQYVKITIENEIECAGVVAKLNTNLPPQIRCLDMIPCEGSFRPTKDSTFKEYRYFFTNLIGVNCSDRRFIANNPYEINFEAMRTCVAAIVGKHDFHNFYSQGSNVTTTIRDVTVCELTQIDPRPIFSSSSIFRLPEQLTSCYQLRLGGNGFLKQMIRHLMTALWKVGNGRLTVAQFLLLLDGPRKTKPLWKVANPKGLFLYRIEYK
jgi:tRNA pseudouridine38-40 synthase